MCIWNLKLKFQCNFIKMPFTAAQTTGKNESNIPHQRKMAKNIGIFYGTKSNILGVDNPSIPVRCWTIDKISLHGFTHMRIRYSWLHGVPDLSALMTSVMPHSCLIWFMMRVDPAACISIELDWIRQMRNATIWMYWTFWNWDIKGWSDLKTWYKTMPQQRLLSLNKWSVL